MIICNLTLKREADAEYSYTEQRLPPLPLLGRERTKYAYWIKIAAVIGGILKEKINFKTITQSSAQENYIIYTSRTLFMPVSVDFVEKYS